MEVLKTLLPWVQVALSIILIALILVQQSEAGLGSAFGSATTGGFAHSKRGLEKIIFNATIVTAILFIVAAIAALFL